MEVWVCVCVDKVDGSPGHGVEPMDMLNKLEMLITVLIMSEDPNSSEIPCVCLGGTHWHAGDTNRPGKQTDGSRGQADELRGQMGFEHVKQC